MYKIGYLQQLIFPQVCDSNPLQNIPLSFPNKNGKAHLLADMSKEKSF